MPNDSLDPLFRALADPARRAMLARLAQGPSPVGELARPLAMSLPSVMQHIGVLEEAGLIRSAKHGRVRTCTLEPARLAEAEAWLGTRRREWEGRLDRLAAWLEANDDT
jgi:DNA-binding transcriptional ArsR family regulator